MKSLIAICGPSGAGKTTLANLLVRKYDYTKVGFAGPIKAMLWTFMLSQGASEAEMDAALYGNLRETPSKYFADNSPRHAMQTLGSEWRDMIHRELWTRAWEKRIEALNVPRVVVDDLRFLHEEKAIRKYNCSRIVRIDRTSYNSSSHISEQEYQHISVDLFIGNNTSPEMLLHAIETSHISLGKPKFLWRWRS